MADWHPASVFGQWLGYWQTLIAGLLAIAAAVGTIWVTKRAADREIDAAQQQIEVTLRLDKQRRHDEQEIQTERRIKLKALIAAELVNVAAGAISAVTFLSSAIFATRVATLAHPSARDDLLKYLPRPMLFTESLGVDLLVLTQREINVLVALRSNLTLTETAMRKEAAATGMDAFINSLVAQKIWSMLRSDSKLLAEAFVEFAPDRKLDLGVGEPELATQLLTRLSQGAVPKVG